MSEFKAPILNGIINIQEQVQSRVKTTWEYENSDWNLIDISGETQVIEGTINDPISYIGIFETTSSTTYSSGSDVADNRNDAHWGSPALAAEQELTGNYSDITNNTRIVEENLKICPTNMDEGAWHKDSNGYYWVSDRPIYPIVISKEGYYDFSVQDAGPIENDSNFPANWDIGTVSANWVNDHSSQFLPKWTISLNGLLMFPYGPALLSHCDNEDADEYGQYYEDRFDVGHPFYHKQGRILGNTNSITKGMMFKVDENNTPINPNIPIITDQP